MALPYSTATSGEKALGEIQKILRGFGCNKFGSMTDDAAGELLVQFEYRGRKVSVKASVNGYAAAWLREHPWSSRTKSTKVQHERKARDIASVAVYSILRDWIKGQVVAIETGILSFEGAFLGQILLADGRTALDHVEPMLPALPAPQGNA
jgi:hypothetical protein